MADMLLPTAINQLSTILFVIAKKDFAETGFFDDHIPMLPAP